jgi:hypothetical protein
VLRWWLDGANARLAETRAFLTGAELAAGTTRSDDLRRARTLLDLLEEGRAVHNPILAHELMGQIAESAQRVYAANTPFPPSPPYLGAPPQLGTCVGCHYDLRMETSGSRMPMNDAFHREVLGRWQSR